MKILTIQMSKWMRGNQQSVLLSETTGKMCCLGFDALACGLLSEEILEMDTPCQVSWNEEVRAKYPDYICGRIDVDEDDLLDGYSNKEFIQQAMEINDKSDITDEKRIELLTPILKELGYDEVIFIHDEVELSLE